MTTNNQLPTTNYSLYIHIPFCRIKCSYCDFNTYAGLDDSFEAYTTALVKEIKAMGHYYKRPQIKTIFIGGGTPTVLSITQLQQILTACYKAYNILPNAEISSEANPGTVDRPYLEALLNTGVNRLSFGAQSFNSTELEMLGRYHTAAQIGKTVTAARQAGVHNLNLDLIYGLPHQTLASWRNTLQQTLDLNPEHLSLYALTLERGTALHAQVARNEFPHPNSDLAADMYELADELLNNAGYTQYEISNWCKADKECEHNLTYWQNKPYLGCGPGAHSFNKDGVKGAKRWWNVRAVPSYIELINKNATSPHPHPTLADSELINPTLEMGETLILGLRLTQQGVSLTDFETRFGQSLNAVYGDVVDKFKGLHLLEEVDNCLRLTPQARLISNQVFIEFLP